MRNTTQVPVPQICQNDPESGPRSRTPADIARLAAALLERAARSDDPSILIEAAQALQATARPGGNQEDDETGHAATG